MLKKHSKNLHDAEPIARESDFKHETTFHETNTESDGVIASSGDVDHVVTADDLQFLANFKASGRHRKLLRRVDYRILPILVWLYLMAYIDRGNIGNAKIAGLIDDLSLSSQQYNWALTAFFFTYTTFEFPANIFLKWLKPTVWLSLCMFSWGVVMTLMGIVQNYAGLVTTRVFLGVCEAGFFPGAIFILSNWYLREELALRTAILYCAASLSGAFSGLLAFAISKMAGIGGLNGWRWIFILEGLLTVISSFFAPFLLSNSIESVKWLSVEEKRYLNLRIRVNRQGRDKGPFKWTYVRQALQDYKNWMIGFCYFTVSCATYGFSFSFPSITKQLGYTTAVAQLMTIPPYVAGVIFTLVFAVLQDKYRKRYLFLMIPYAIGICGYVILLSVPQPRLPGLVIWACFFITIANYSAVPSLLVWNANNQAGAWKRGISIGLQFMITNFGGVVGSNIYRTQDAPRYFLGNGFTLGLILLACCVATACFLLLRRENRLRDRLTVEEVRAKYTQDELDLMGDKSPLFRYEL